MRFIESAKQESIEEILELAKLKKEGRIKAIIVTGCLSERYQGDVMKELYEVDASLASAQTPVLQISWQSAKRRKGRGLP